MLKTAKDGSNLCFLNIHDICFTYNFLNHLKFLEEPPAKLCFKRIRKEKVYDFCHQDPYWTYHQWLTQVIQVFPILENLFSLHNAKHKFLSIRRTVGLLLLGNKIEYKMFRQNNFLRDPK